MDDFMMHQHSDELGFEADLELERELLREEQEDVYRMAREGTVRADWIRPVTFVERKLP